MVRKREKRRKASTVGERVAMVVPPRTESIGGSGGVVRMFVSALVVEIRRQKMKSLRRRRSALSIVEEKLLGTTKPTPYADFSTRSRASEFLPIYMPLPDKSQELGKSCTGDGGARQNACNHLFNKILISHPHVKSTCYPFIIIF